MGAPTSRHASLIFGVAAALLACNQSNQTEDAAGPVVVARDANVVEASSVDAAVVDAAVVDAVAVVDVMTADGAVDVDAMSEIGMKKIEEIAALIYANREHCDAVGERAAEYYRENVAFIDDAKDVYGKMPANDRRVIQKRHRARFDAAWKKLQPVVKKCKEDDNVKMVLDKIF